VRLNISADISMGSDLCSGPITWLLYMRNFAENNWPFRWSVRLSELDFLVEQRSVHKIRHADALSQQVGTVMLANTLDKKSTRSVRKVTDLFFMRTLDGL